MDELMYQALNDYFKSLKVMGYKSYDVGYKLIVMSFIYEITNTELRYYITNNDIKLMQDLLYQLIGSTCEISFPTNNRPCCCCSGLINGPDQLSVSIVLPESKVIFAEGNTSTAKVSTVEVTANQDGYLTLTQGNRTVYEGNITQGTHTITLSPEFTQAIEGLTVGTYRYNFIATLEAGSNKASSSTDFTIEIVANQQGGPYYYKASDSDFTSVSSGNTTSSNKFTVNVPTSKWWVAIPSTKSLVIENADFRGDWYYDPNNGYTSNFLTISTISVNNTNYTLYTFRHFLPLDMNLEVTIR